MLNLKQILKIEKKFRKGNKIDLIKLSQSILKNFKSKSDGFVEVGNILKLIGERRASKNFYFKAIKANPNNSDAYNKIGISYRVSENLFKAEKYFKKSLENQPENSDAYHNLGNILKEKKRYLEAINCYKKVVYLHSKNKNNKYVVKPIISIAKMLECIYFSKGVKKYLFQLKKIKKIENCDIRISTMSSYVASRESIKNIYPFCKNPIDQIYTVNLKELLIKKKINSNKILKTCKKIKAIWEPSARVTRGGYQTIDNLFQKKSYEIKELKNLVEKEIIKYKTTYKEKSDLLHKKWPKKYNLRAWFVRLLNQGFQKSHIHPTAWLSGVFYLKVPRKLKNNEGAIKLTLHGYDYPKKKKMKEFIFKPKNFDLIIFPSSLFHSTVPFSANEERCVIPFDMVPQKQTVKYFKEQLYF